MKEMLEFLWKKKNWWLIPPFVIFFIFGALVLFSQVSPIGAFVYMLF
jgi:hypothetical protein